MNVTCGRPIQGASKSGLNVTISSTGRRRMPSTTRPNVSRLVGSVQWASSKIISTGRWLANLATCVVWASSILCLRCSGARSIPGYRPSFGSDSISANNAASCLEVEVCASAASSLSSFARARSVPLDLPVMVRTVAKPRLVSSAMPRSDMPSQSSYSYPKSRAISVLWKVRSCGS